MSGMHPTFRKLFIIFMILITLCVAAGGFAIGALLGYMDELPMLEELDNYNPNEVSRVYDRTGNNQLAELFAAERREFVSIKTVPPHVANAFIAIEDERFENHYGVDLRGAGRAIWKTVLGARREGASTITMQVARGIVLNDSRRVWSRKIREVFTALQMERHLSKEQILELYMNHIFFGARAYGVQAAARAYFNKDVRDLTVPEAAMIAGLPQAPSRLSPTRNIDAARNRRNLVLNNMRRLGYIKTDEELRRYLDTEIELNPAKRPPQQASYFADYVRALLVKDNQGEDAAEELARKGYTVISTVDLKLQQICEEELRKGLAKVELAIQEQKPARFSSESAELGSVKKGQARLATIRSIDGRKMTVSIQGYTADITLPEKVPYFHPDQVLRPGKLIDIYIQNVQRGRLEAYLYDKTHVQGSAVVLDVRNGEVLALAGGADYDDDTNNGQWNRAYQGGRQPGSCWKPLLYAASFDVVDRNGNARFTPGTVINDSPMSVGAWSPKNYEGSFYGATALCEALVKSRNIPTVKLFLDIGMRQAIPLYNKFNVVNKEGWDLPAVAPMALGTPNVTPLELAAAYAVFANGGTGITPTPFRRIYSTKSPGDSRVVRPERQQVISPQAAFMTVRIMQDVINRGTAKTTVGNWIMQEKAKGRKLPEMGAKTGTTNGCYVAWMVGYTPDIVLAIYVGYDQHRSMGPKIVGGGNVGPIWAPMMDRILQTRDDWNMKFETPSGVSFATICSKSGHLATSNCYASGNVVYKDMAFKQGTQPTSSCGYHSGAAMYETDGYEDDVEAAYPTAPPGMVYQQPGAYY